MLLFLQSFRNKRQSLFILWNPFELFTTLDFSWFLLKNLIFHNKIKIALYPRVILNFRHWRPLFGVYFQKWENKAFAIFRNWHFGRKNYISRNDRLCGCSRRWFSERQLAKNHTIQHDSTGPNVNSCSVAFFLSVQDLRGHITKSSDINIWIECISYSWYAKICNFYLEIIFAYQQHILQL